MQGLYSTHDSVRGVMNVLRRRQPHHFDRTAHACDEVVHACMWSDGGAEFIYVDGTVLSFRDEMGTFVALRERDSGELSSSTRDHCTTTTAAKLHAQHKSHASAPAVTSNSSCGTRSETMTGGDLLQRADEGTTEREIFVTAWTISKYAAKVRAALMLYNRYAPHPRLIAGLLPRTNEGDDDGEDDTCCAGESEQMPDSEEATMLAADSIRTESDRHTLVLAEDCTLLERHAVRRGRAHQHLCHTDSDNESTSSSDRSRASSFSSSSVAGDRDFDKSNHSDGCHVCKNGGGGDCFSKTTAVTLWCAQRRVRLMLHPSRLFFTVRWPAPLSPTRCPHASLFGAATVPTVADVCCGRVRRGWVWLEQTFATQAAPPEWQAMVQLTLRLERQCDDATNAQARNKPGTTRRRCSAKHGTRTNTTQAVVSSSCAATTSSPIPTARVPAANTPAKNGQRAWQTCGPSACEDVTSSRTPHTPPWHRHALPRAALDATCSTTAQTFSSIQPHHRHRMTHTRAHVGAACQSLFHPSCVADCHAESATVLWRYDAGCGTLTGCPPYTRIRFGQDCRRFVRWQPCAIYWYILPPSPHPSPSSLSPSALPLSDCCAQAEMPRSMRDAAAAAVVCVVAEDESVIQMQRHRDAMRTGSSVPWTSTSAATALTYTALYAAPPRPAAVGATYAMRHWRGGGCVRTYYVDSRDAHSTLPVLHGQPRRVGDGVHNSALTPTSAKVRWLTGTGDEDTTSRPSAAPEHTRRGFCARPCRRVRCSAFAHPFYSRIADYDIAHVGAGRYLDAVHWVCVLLLSSSVSAAYPAATPLPCPDRLSTTRACACATLVRSGLVHEGDVAARDTDSSRSLCSLDRGTNPKHAGLCWSDSCSSSSLSSSHCVNAPPGRICVTADVPGVGRFTAIEDGGIRCVFADRTRLTIAPGANSHIRLGGGDGNDNGRDWTNDRNAGRSGVVLSCLFRDASRATVSVTQMTASHPIYPYATYALLFREYVQNKLTAPTDDATFLPVRISGHGKDMHASARSDDGALAATEPPPAQVGQTFDADDDEMCVRHRTRVEVRKTTDGAAARPGARSVVHAQSVVEALLEHNRQLARDNRALMREYDMEQDQI